MCLLWAIARGDWANVPRAFCVLLWLIITTTELGYADDFAAERTKGGPTNPGEPPSGGWSDDFWMYSPMPKPRPTFPRNVGDDRYIVNLNDFQVELDNGVGADRVTVSGLSIGPGGVLSMSSNVDLAITSGGTIGNAGLIEITSTGSSLITHDGVVTLSGGGTILLDGGSIFGTGSEPRRLVNLDNTIAGNGAVGIGQTAITNRATIVAQGGKVLEIDPSAGTAELPGDVKNEGLLLAEGTGILRLARGLFNNASGTIRADAGSFVEMSGAAHIKGGILEAKGTGRFRTFGSSTSTLEDVHLREGTLEVRNDHDVVLSGFIFNEGEIALNAINRLTRLLIAGDEPVLLFGNGRVTLNNAPFGIIQGTSNQGRLNIGATQSIEGSGSLGNASLLITNSGTISANLPFESLILEPTRGSTMINTRVLEARNAGVLNLRTSIIENATGTIRVLDDSFVDLNGVTVKGGVLTNAKPVDDPQPSGQRPGYFRVFGTTTTLDGMADTVIIDAPIDVTSTTLHLKGTIDNRQEIVSIRSSNTIPGTSHLRLDDTVTLEGRGLIQTALQSHFDISGFPLINTNNRLRGDFRIFSQLVNQKDGILVSDFGGEIMSVVVPDGVENINAGMMTAGIGGTLTIHKRVNSSKNATLNNAGGTILADRDGTVSIAEVDIKGGRLESRRSPMTIESMFTLESLTVSNNAILVGDIDGFNVTLDNVINFGRFLGAATLRRSINNGGEINSFLAPENLRIDGDVRLTGGGLLAASRITGSTSGSRLINVDNTIKSAMVGPMRIDVAITNEAGGTILIEKTSQSSTGPDLILSRSPTINNGNIVARQSRIRVDVDVSGTGRWIANQGTIEISPGVHVSTTGPVFLQNGSTLRLRNSRMNLSNLLTDGTETIDIQSTVAVTNSFIYELTDEANWMWGADSNLEMLGGVGAGIDDWNRWGTLEVAGANLGDDPAGFTSNFEIPELVIGPGAHISLLDLIDNGNRNGGGRGSEALYVETLTFSDPDGLLNLNGSNLYFNSLSGDLSQIIDSPVQFVGDYNSSGIVDVGDYTVWRDTLGSMSDLRADGNRDGVVNQADYQVWSSNYGFPFTSLTSGTVAVPEPALSAMLASLLIMAAFRGSGRSAS